MKHHITFITVLLFLVALPVAQACSCMYTTPEERYESAEVIFEGSPFFMFHTSRTSYILFESSSIIKGDPAILLIRSSRNSAACGYAFELSTHYRVYANYAKDGVLTTTLCSGNEKLNQEDDLAIPSIFAEDTTYNAIVLK